MTGLERDELESAGEMAAALQEGDVTAIELAERAIGRAEAWQPFTNAFSQLWAEEALAAAGSLDALAPSDRPSPVAGVPIAVKDLFDVAGHETTGCCAAYRGTLAGRDAPIIERVRQAGLVMIGKTNQHELAAGGTNLVSACGRTGNPWDPARMTGGSSGGSAAAVAAGVVPWALGSDTGGSIRIPASLCGIYGLKPATGRLPLEGLMPLAPSMDCPGPLAARAFDLQELYGVMADSPVSPVKDGETHRIAILEGFFEEVVDRQAKRAVEFATKALTGNGAAVEPIDGRGIEDARRAWMDVCTPEFAEAHPLLKDPERRRLVAPQVVEWLELGERLTVKEREAASRRREEIARWFRERLEGFDALLMPTTPYPAPRADQEVVDLGDGRTIEVARVGPGYMTSSVNLSGLPALNLMVPPSAGDMPTGVSLVGHPDGEPRLLALAALWEVAAGSQVRPPPLPTS